MKPPMPLATTIAIVSAWLHSRRRSRSTLRSRARMASPGQFGWREPPRGLLDPGDAAIGDADDAVRHRRDGRVVRDDDGRGAQVLVDAGDDFQHQLAGRIV